MASEISAIIVEFSQSSDVADLVSDAIEWLEEGKLLTAYGCLRAASRKAEGEKRDQLEALAREVGAWPNTDLLTIKERLRDAIR